MARAKRIADVEGVSSTGTSHGVRVEVTDTAAVVVTITGANGTKRHASVRFAVAGDVEALITALQTARGAL